MQSNELNTVNEFKSALKPLSSIKFDGHIKLNLFDENPAIISELKNKLNSLKVRFVEFDSNNIIIELDSNNFAVKVFFDKSHFLRMCSEQTFNKDFAILDYENKLLFFDSISRNVYVNDELIKNEYFLENTEYYLKLLNCFQKKPFADYWNSVHNEIVIFSATKGIFKMKYPIIKPDFGSIIRIKEFHDTLIDKFSKQDYLTLFKNELFDFLKTEPVENRITGLINQLTRIIEVTNQNYDLLLKNFSFDSLKSKLLEEKDRYFSSLRELLSKIQTQSISIPISISASVFASYKVDNSPVLVLILIAFVFYSLLYIHFQLLLSDDLVEIESEFRADFEKIRQSGIDNETITKEEHKIDNRIKYLKFTIWLLIYVVLIFSVLFFVFVITQLCIPIYLTIFAFVFMLLIFLIRILFKKIVN